MIHTVEAMVGPDGRVQLLAPLRLDGPRRAFVTVIEKPTTPPGEAALLAEAVLSDWNRPEEDAAWSHLQPAK